MNYFGLVMRADGVSEGCDVGKGDWEGGGRLGTRWIDVSTELKGTVDHGSEP